MLSKKNTVPPPVAVQDFPVVGVGASAGGLDAFKRLIKTIPLHSGMAFVIVQHLDPKHESVLADILARVTDIPVNGITDEINIAPDHIYVMPSNKILVNVDGILKLAPLDKMKRNLPIDIFFTSLAEVHQSLAVGIVLSGTASDGTLGLKAIKEYGGITFAQDKETAEFGEMPHNAISAGVVDFILPPEEIPEKLLQVWQTYNGAGWSEYALSKDDEYIFKQMISALSQRSGVDFTYYKQTTMRRRVARRMAINKKDKFADYLKFLRSSKAEQDALFSDMLLPVTSFFRDAKIFQTLREKIFPALLRNKSSNPIRIWVAGCSTGQEAYSLAILLREFLGEEESGRQIQIFASDVSQSAISKARMAIYNRMEMKDVPDGIVKQYFTKNNDNYQVNKEIRDLCVFAVHNFLKDPAFAKMDLISCRNVLIYMDAFLQKKALTTFHYALKESGFLLLGKSETAGPAIELYSIFAKDEKIYSRKPVPARILQLPAEIKKTGQARTEKKDYRLESHQTDFRKSAETILLSKYTPASVIVDEQMEIVHVHGVIAPFLEPPQGRPTYNLLKMARETLAFELRNGLHKVKTTNEPFVKQGLIIKSNGHDIEVSIEIVPLANIAEPHFLILFYKKDIPDKAAKSRQKGGKESRSGAEDAQRIAQLEKELSQTREDMRAITEDQEAVNEELQSANEELLSSNEEMQSLNEEMETSKEELQSTNEELTIVNQELVDKQEQINASRVYAEAIIATVREPLVVLDKQMCIKTMNPSFAKLFNITEHESIGEPIYEIKNHLFDYPVLLSMLEKVLSKRTEVVNDEIEIELPNSGKRTMQVIARYLINEVSKEQLVLLTIEDITERKSEIERMKAFSEKLESEVKDRTAALEQTNMQLEQFAHTASHELQEPLRKIQTFTKKLRSEVEKGKSEELNICIDKIEESSGRLAQLIRQLLDFASISQHESNYEKVNLNDTFNEILVDFELLIPEKNATITSDKLPEIQAIPFQMHQIFYDIINNSLKFSKPDVPALIHVSSKKLTKEQVKLHPGLNEKFTFYEITIQDNGIGFDQKYAQQIFTIFQRLDRSGTYPGTGIGLALCKKITQSYHGEIYARSKVNVGTSIHIIMPARQPKARTKPNGA